MNLRALSCDELAELMTVASKAADKSEVTVEQIAEMVSNGLPQNPDETFNLIHVNAWLARGYL
jgi:hypothetical protein